MVLVFEEWGAKAVARKAREVVDSYEQLINARKACRECTRPWPGRRLAKMPLLNGMDFGTDPDVVSHWSQWLGHRSPKLLIVGQDFSNVDYFRKYGGRDDPESKINWNLWELLNKRAEIFVGPPSRSDPNAPVYLTNSILCLKDGPMNAPVPGSWVDTCRREHLAGLINLLRPSVVVGMGVSGWRAVRGHFGLDADPETAPAGIREAAGRSWSVSQARVFAVGHCGPLGIANRPWPLQAEDWRRIGSAFAAL